jgi:hypothetical protein
MSRSSEGIRRLKVTGTDASIDPKNPEVVVVVGKREAMTSPGKAPWAAHSTGRMGAWEPRIRKSMASAVTA